MLVPGAYQVCPAPTPHSHRMKLTPKPTTLTTPQAESHLLSDVYWLITSDYTSRAMTNESDSLNALLGVLNVWERTLLPPGSCVWGLPLKAHPACLGWMHPRGVGASPRRRPAFPSWSWTGWAGEVSTDVGLLPGEGATTGMGVVVGRDMTVGWWGWRERWWSWRGGWWRGGWA